MGQYIPAESPLHRCDARSKIAATAGLSLSLLIAPGWTNTLVVSGVIVILIILSRINFRSYLANWRILFILVLITVLLQILLIPGKTILRLSFINITQEGLISGSMLLVKLSGIILLAAWLTFTTRPAQLTAGLERIFSPLGKLGFPVQELVMIMTLSLRFLPLLVEETLMVYRAQLVRGANWRTGTLGQKGRYLIALLVPILRLALERAEYLVEAMENRGYNSGPARTPLYPQSLHLGDGLLVAVTCLILVMQVI
ncbi:MAG TPA: transporter [Syntrophomonas sp.]|jgi:energy-coupling factor transport system permease protein|nr:energy-coupling factor transporter transmembrane component T [Bacillota bacterium]HAA09714.1 transporter [Syntrophomonas sp.]HQA49530.1 energy-coupling factor transporter transmembrane component T [Syntrophomonadaceae bacterium]HQD90449.1 energy-coupling factor transporter transmembrane component T [Syntrophomonadaceae bacterium]